ncbi:TCF4_12 [Acanthosepion pharaonis]|uniref:TCF4_12 n=1 Tax=Acanthosepion pharaonis TaxID=158019 RepID=A0A812DIF1_ACAPH|nr:TCF4_12 [Sepia pharaonis]
MAHPARAEFDAPIAKANAASTVVAEKSSVADGEANEASDDIGGDKTIIVNGRRLPLCGGAEMGDLLGHQPSSGLFPDPAHRTGSDAARTPKVPVGSPPPVLGKTRFGMTMGGDIALPGGDPSVAIEAGALPGGARSYGWRVVGRSCGGAELSADVLRRERIDAGAPHVGDGARSVHGRRRICDARYLAAQGFALFDQGRCGGIALFPDAVRRLTDHNGGDEAALFVAKLLLAGFGDGDENDRAIKSLKRAALTNYVERLH